MPENKLLLPAFVLCAALGAYVSRAGAPYQQFLPLTLAGTDPALRIALAGLPPGGQPILFADCLFAALYAFVLSAAASELAPFSASPGMGRMLARAVWLGAAADLAENLMLIRILDNPEAALASWLRAAAVLKFGIFIAACGWVGGAAWRARRFWWSAAALIAAALVLFSIFPFLLAG